jgi:hypothetical protein
LGFKVGKRIFLRLRRLVDEEESPAIWFPEYVRGPSVDASSRPARQG